MGSVDAGFPRQPTPNAISSIQGVVPSQARDDDNRTTGRKDGRTAVRRKEILWRTLRSLSSCGPVVLLSSGGENYDNSMTRLPDAPSPEEAQDAGARSVRGGATLNEVAPTILRPSVRGSSMSSQRRVVEGGRADTRRQGCRIVLTQRAQRTQSQSAGQLLVWVSREVRGAGVPASLLA